MQQRIAIIGGTGFVGRHISSELARRGHRVRVLTRRRERDRDLIVIPSLELLEVDVHSTAALSDALHGCDAVINLAGVLHGSGAQGEGFDAVHARLPARIAEAAAFNRISRLLHMCALGAAPDAPSHYLRSKAEGEAAVFADGGLQVTSFRPSVIFGPQDRFFNQFAGLLAVAPFVFPLACADARFAPVYVGDVARAFVDCLEQRKGVGERFELCGPRDYTLKELVQYTARCAGLRRVVVGLGDALSRLQASLLGMLPRPMFTYDNYLSMQVPSVCSDNGFGRLGIAPTSLESVVPGYIGSGGRAGLYDTLRRSAGR
jgi:NADH dehydrogenase